MEKCSYLSGDFSLYSMNTGENSCLFCTESITVCAVFSDKTSKGVFSKKTDGDFHDVNF